VAVSLQVCTADEGSQTQIFGDQWIILEKLFISVCSSPLLSVQSCICADA